MARVADCPKCSHELFVPDDAQADDWAKCPQCRAFFQVNEVSARDLPALLLVDSAPGDASDDEHRSARTLADFSSSATLSDSNDDDLLGSEPSTSEAETIDIRVGDDKSDDLAAAATRIDEWFRSAKQQVDPSPDSELQDSPSIDDPLDDVIPAGKSTGATVFYDPATAVDALTSGDFDLDETSEPSPTPAAWDDTSEMDGLLAEVEPAEVDDVEEAEEQLTAVDDDDDAATSVPFTPELATESAASRTSTRRRKRSPVRMLVMVLLGGVIGLAGGYYALLWLRGPSMDFLQVAPYLPQAMLPSSFHNEPRQLAASLPPSTPAPAPAETVEQPDVEATEPVEPAEFAASQPEETADETPEMPASYTTTEDQAEASTAPEDDRYALDTAAGEIMDAEPLDGDEIASEPPAEVVEAISDEAPAEAAPAAEVARPVDAPSFTAADLSAAYDAAKIALPSLISGNLADSREIARAKGYGYSMLADLAQKAAFVEATAPTDTTMQLQQATDELFQQTLSDDHTRGEIAVILPKWLASPNRKHGGVFFAATMTDSETKGSVTECRAELESGQSITVLVPAAAAGRLAESSRPMAVLGWVVDRPMEQVEGYTGAATQAIWVNRLIPLQ